jgi:hypothetical protein
MRLTGSRSGYEHVGGRVLRASSRMRHKGHHPGLQEPGLGAIPIWELLQGWAQVKSPTPTVPFLPLPGVFGSEHLQTLDVKLRLSMFLIPEEEEVPG